MACGQTTHRTWHCWARTNGDYAFILSNAICRIVSFAQHTSLCQTTKGNTHRAARRGHTCSLRLPRAQPPESNAKPSGLSKALYVHFRPVLTNRLVLELGFTRHDAAICFTLTAAVYFIDIGLLLTLNPDPSKLTRTQTLPHSQTMQLAARGARVVGRVSLTVRAYSRFTQSNRVISAPLASAQTHLNRRSLLPHIAPASAITLSSGRSLSR